VPSPEYETFTAGYMLPRKRSTVENAPAANRQEFTEATPVHCRIHRYPGDWQAVTFVSKLPSMAPPFLSRLFRLFKNTPSVVCPICDKPVPLETAKTDSDGKAVHEHCYFHKVKLKRIKDGYA